MLTFQLKLKPVLLFWPNRMDLCAIISYTHVVCADFFSLRPSRLPLFVIVLVSPYFHFLSSRLHLSLFRDLTVKKFLLFTFTGFSNGVAFLALVVKRAIFSALFTSSTLCARSTYGGMLEWWND